MNQKQGNLVVSFGTSYEETRKKTIEAIEVKIQDTFPDSVVYRAFTSGKIIQKLKCEQNICVDTVYEALTRMKEDGMTQMLIQPTHMINGYENEQMRKDLELFFQKEENQTISYAVGAPLLTEPSDYEKIADAVLEGLVLQEQEALVLMGHGTGHFSNSAYPAMSYLFHTRQEGSVYLATVEGYPTIAHVMQEMRKQQIKKVILKPFMIVAGDHAQNDMAGKQEDSWKNLLRAEGYEVECRMEGLGEETRIQNLAAEHALHASRQLNGQLQEK